MTPAAKKALAQPATRDQAEIFDQLQAMLARYARKFTVRTTGVPKKRNYGLVSEKPATIHGRPMDEVWFTGIIQQKGYIGFYFMPVYTHPEMKKQIPATVLKLLKGKSCFYVKSLDTALLADLEKSVKAGLELYQRNKYI